MQIWITQSRCKWLKGRKGRRAEKAEKGKEVYNLPLKTAAQIIALTMFFLIFRTRS